ncbi:MAG: hypothetical protein EP343_01285 [Deltaproteobacteria bacterium]|nr:MAG: hypothetical protein EP343_01285 [Deltaproteobacteria bacterium]
MSPKTCCLLVLLFCWLPQNQVEASSPSSDLCGRLCQPSSSQASQELAEKATPVLQQFFRAEKLSGWVWGSVGLVSAGVGVGLVLMESPILQGMAYPMMIIGGLQLVYGVILLAASDGRAQRALQQMRASPGSFLTKEAARIKKNTFLFSLIEWFEIIVATTGFGLVAGGMMGGMPLVAGVGLGLMLKGLTMFALDSQAHQRYSQQHKLLQRLLPSLTLSPSAYDREQGRTLRIGLAWSGRF